MEPIEIFTAIDLEMNQPSKKIIQIGACAGNVFTGEILGKLSIFVNPQEALSKEIIELTHITQDDVDNGTTLLNAYEVLKRFHLEHKSFINPVTWGGGDSKELMDQLQKENPEAHLDWPFGRRWIDVKTDFISIRIAKRQPLQGGLARSVTKLGFNFQGKKHNAMDDSYNTFLAFAKIIELLGHIPDIKR